MKKICTICVYFGNLPNYFKIWLFSCANNPSIDFFLVTDNQLTKLPSNVHLINMSFKDFLLLCQKNVGLELQTMPYYKICDLKPMFGNIFKEYLSNYDFWGHCDLDMVFGNLINYLNKYNIGLYNRFSPNGHLSFYKNDDFTNNIYKLSGARVSYKLVLADSMNFFFDEFDGVNQIFNKHKIPFFQQKLFSDFAPAYKTAVRDSFETFSEHKQTVYVYANKSAFKIRNVSGTWENCGDFFYFHYQKRNFKFVTNPKNYILFCPNEILGFDTFQQLGKFLDERFNSPLFLNEVFEKYTYDLSLWPKRITRFFKLKKAIKEFSKNRQ